MTVVLAHIGHWYTWIVYLVPVIVVGLLMWWGSREQADPDDEAADPAEPGRDS